MKILVVSVAGDGLSIARRLAKEGHTVWMSILSPQAERVGEGLIAKAPDPVDAAYKADLVVVDMIGWGSTADVLRDDGIAVLAASKFADRLEEDRLHAFDVARSIGLDVPPMEVFPDADFDRAIHFVEAHNEKWVFKPSGNLGTDKTFLAEDAEEMIDYLEHLAETLPAEEPRMPPFVLQKFMPGAECSVERFYAQGIPIPTMDNCTLEEKKFMSGNLGPAVGCAGCIVIPGGDPILIREAAKFDPVAAAHNFTGQIDWNFIVDPGHRWFLEPTPRFGYDGFFAYAETWKTPLGEVFQAIAEGEVPDIRFHPGLGAAVRVSVPPYPSPECEKAKGFPVVDDILDEENIWPLDVMLDQRERLVIAGSDATAYVVTARGDGIRTAYEGCYRWLGKSRLPDRQYRVDLAHRAIGRLTQLRSWGYFRNGR